MIARLWTGVVEAQRAEAYVRLMRTVALPDYRKTDGNRGAWCLHRLDGARAVIMMLTFWEDLEAVRRFAGDAVERAKYYDFDADFLIDAPEEVIHFQLAD